LEYWHYYKSIKRYNHFNNLRLPNIIPEDEMNKLVDVIVDKNPKIFRRCQKFIHTKHIKNKTDLYNAFFIDTKTEYPSNYVKIGCSKLYWQYIPFCIDFVMKIIREIGNLHLSSIGFIRTWYNTKDGYYSIWTFHKKNTKPLIIFPGVGFGAIPYGKLSKSFNRTVYIIEVPNLGYATPLSNSHCTSESLYDTISIHLHNNNPNYDTLPDILAHSLGSSHAAMYVNESYIKNNLTSRNKLLPKQNIVLCDPISCIYDSIISHLYPFVDYCDYKTNIIRVNNKFEFYRYILLSHSLEFNSWCKRYHNLYNGTFWRDYPYSNIKYIYSKNDILMDSEYIITQMNPTEYIFNKKGKHGSCLFGKNSEIVRKHICDILNTEK
jgi:hypothetical protein